LKRAWRREVVREGGEGEKGIETHRALRGIGLYEEVFLPPPPFVQAPPRASHAG